MGVGAVLDALAVSDARFPLALVVAALVVRVVVRPALPRAGSGRNGFAGAFLAGCGFAGLGGPPVPLLLPFAPGPEGVFLPFATQAARCDFPGLAGATGGLFAIPALSPGRVLASSPPSRRVPAGPLLEVRPDHAGVQRER